MQLVSVETEEEDQAITNLWLMSSSTGYWTSGSDYGHEGRWIWTAMGKNISYTNWDMNEPNNQGGVEHYLHLNRVLDHWNDSNEAKVFYFLCEARP